MLVHFCCSIISFNILLFILLSSNSSLVRNMFLNYVLGLGDGTDNQRSDGWSSARLCRTAPRIGSMQSHAIPFLNGR
jgi:hypothetical protein